MKPGKARVVIVKKKKAHGGGHHGGSWKVAYADFVTAMMAFFMVMWILGMDENLKESIEGYFSNPVGYKKGYSSGTSPLASGSSPASVKNQTLRLVMRSHQERQFEQTRSRIRATLGRAHGLRSIGAQIEIVVAKDGLRIELVEANQGETFFPFGSAALKPTATLALTLIARELAELSNPVVVEGHTDSAPFGSPRYSNWELSADRANAARRVLEAAGLDRARITEVRGLADQRLRMPQNPRHPSNRRISILLPFTTPPPDGESALPVSGT
jgi:chemotaxis protein MotB